MAKKDAPRLYLIDGSAYIFRAYHAIRGLTGPDGRSTNAVYGFTSMLINVLRDEQPTHLAVAFDVSRQTFRSAQYEQYKATRSASPAEDGTAAAGG